MPELPPAPAAESALIKEFSRYLENDLDTFFGISVALSDLECEPYGNLGTLVPVVAFLSLCGLPLPPAFSRWEVSCTAFAPFLRGELRFFLQAQSAYVRAIVRSMERRLTLAELAVRAGARRPTLPASGNAAMENGWSHVWLENIEGAPRRILHWHGRPISHVTTLDEWIRLTQGLAPAIYPGATVTKVTPHDLDELPFYTLNWALIEIGERKGSLVCRHCARPAQAPSLAHYDLSPDHSLAQWLSGYEPLPDRLVKGSDVTLATETAGDWASLSATDPWRELIIGHLQRTVSRSYSTS